ncbi:Rieske 2Fe-2S domain-containing protein [Nocardioides sp. LHG3406-4]|uniref:Rieske 2Fe-2S domain-containing protein n=1 Tax=Nocardioides sp. LHG3406-4 TaxID=2804575 RepID=UPI003CF8746B
MRITKELNERLTRVGQGTAMGEVFRRYWIPACLSEELPASDGAPIRVRLLGEDLVAFRDSNGDVGLVDAFCAHRRAPLFYGRNEECGLRCVFHGWKFDATGACVDMPSEPPSSKFKTRVSIKAYPTYEAGGIVWTYMGPQKLTPEVPDYEWLRTPSTHLRVSKTGEQCNFLQAVEGGIDTVHSSFAHNEDLGNNRLLRARDTHPKLEVDVKEHGFTYASVRNISDDETYLRIYQFLMPFQQSRGRFIDWEGKKAGLPSVHGHLWVPIDDENTFVYNFMYSTDESYPISDDYWDSHEARFGRGKDDFIPGTYWLRVGPENDYEIDRELQRTKTFTGIRGINTQDFALQVGMGPIVDRSLEALGSTDRAIQTARRLLLEAADEVESGGMPRGSDPEDHRDTRGTDMLVVRGTDWRDASKEATKAQWH